MDSWYLVILQSSATNVQTFIIREMRAVLHGMILRLELSGHSWLESIREMLLLKDISWRMEQL